MTVLDIKKLTATDKDYVQSIMKKEHLIIQVVAGRNPVVFKGKSDFLMIDVGMPISEEPDETIEVKTFGEFMEWWPAIKKGLGFNNE